MAGTDDDRALGDCLREMAVARFGSARAFREALVARCRAEGVTSYSGSAWAEHVSGRSSPGIVLRCCIMRLLPDMAQLFLWVPATNLSGGGTRTYSAAEAVRWSREYAERLGERLSREGGSYGVSELLAAELRLMSLMVD